MRYKELLKLPIGAYSEATGYSVIREDVTKYNMKKYFFRFIQKRDQTKSKPNNEDIVLTDGSSQSISIMLNLFIKGVNDGVMIPIP